MKQENEHLLPSNDPFEYVIACLFERVHAVRTTLKQSTNPVNVAFISIKESSAHLTISVERALVGRCEESMPSSVIFHKHF